MPRGKYKKEDIKKLGDVILDAKTSRMIEQKIAQAEKNLSQRAQVRLIHLPEFLKTERLTLRRWKESDLEPFIAMNMDAQVMRYFPKIMEAEKSREYVKKIEESFEKEDLGLWAAEIKQTKEFIGFIGLNKPTFSAHFTPCVEIGWRIAVKFWGQGYAPEAAKEVLKDGFERLDLKEIVSFTTANNKNSIRVMEKIGMVRNPVDDFNHPLIGAKHPLCAHVLYRLSKDQWLTQHNNADLL